MTNPQPTAEELPSFSNTNLKYVAYKTSYNNDLYNIVDQHNNKPIVKNLTYKSAKKIIDELNGEHSRLQAIAEEVKNIDTQKGYTTAHDVKQRVQSIIINHGNDE